MDEIRSEYINRARIDKSNVYGKASHDVIMVKSTINAVLCMIL